MVVMGRVVGIFVMSEVSVWMRMHCAVVRVCVRMDDQAAINRRASAYQHRSLANYAGGSAAIIIFKIAIPTRLGLAMEFAVAIVLILLGIGAAAGVIRNAATLIRGGSSVDENLIVHAHAHSHDGAMHAHPHAHLAHHEDAHDATHHDHRIAPEALPTFSARRPLLRSFAVGLVHGLAGSGAIALLVLSAIPNPLWATLYLAIFCIGTVIGMGLITTAIATPFMLVSRRASWIRQTLVTGSGLLSFGFGLFLAYQIGIVDHLFSSAPIWIPQ